MNLLKKTVITATVFSAMIVAGAHAAAYDCCEEMQPCCASPGYFFLDAEALYLRAYEGGLSSLCDTSETTDIVIGNTTLSDLRGKGHEPRFKWDWGYRVGVGYTFADSDCGARAYWTHFNSKTKHRTNRWKLDFDVVDIIFACETELSNCVTLTPFAGLKLANIQQRLNASFISTLNTIPSTSTSGVKQELRGIGPYLGFEGSFATRFGLSFYADLAVALLYGNTHVRVHGVEIFDTGTNFNRLRGHRDAYQFVLDAGIGIRWQKCFCKNKFLIVQFGLEDHRYFNHNQFCDYGDLSLDGCSLGVQLEF